MTILFKSDSVLTTFLDIPTFLRVKVTRADKIIEIAGYIKRETSYRR